MNLKKAFDRVPGEVVWWALRYLGVDEWIVSNMVGLVAPVETLPSRRTNYSWCSNQTNTACSEPWRDGRR